MAASAFAWHDDDPQPVWSARSDKNDDRQQTDSPPSTCRGHTASASGRRSAETGAAFANRLERTSVTGIFSDSGLGIVLHETTLYQAMAVYDGGEGLPGHRHNSEKSQNYYGSPPCRDRQEYQSAAKQI